jgi:carboxyl-terminal processing protease
MKKLTWFLLLVALMSSAAVARHQQVAPKTVVELPSLDGEIELRQKTFDIVWTTVKEKHFDPTFGGVDWDRIRETYSPRVAAVKTDQELYVLLQQMLGELHQSHFNIIPPEAIVDDSSPEPATGGVGIDVRIVSGKALINRVEADSPAAKAGIKAGFIVNQVDQTGVDVIASKYTRSTEREPMNRLRLARGVLSRINGKPGTTVRLECLDGHDRVQSSTLVRERLRGEMSPRFGNLPPQYTEFEARTLAGGVGYIRFNIFVMLMMDRVREALREMHDAPGIIFDLRGNPGGLGGMSSGIAGLLETKQTSLGRMTMRSGYQNFAVFPQKNAYTGPVAILIDVGSASTSEVFAAGMQEIGRATIVGERSVGAALPSIIQALPTGALFQYAVADFKTPKGTLIEGRGVIPDIETGLDRSSLLEGHDPQLEAAVKWIQKTMR